MRGTPQRRSGRGEASCQLRGQHRIVEEMEADGPGQTLISAVEAALDEIADHGQQFVEILALGRHLRLVAGRHQHVVILFDLKDELFLHGATVPHQAGLCKSARPGTLPGLNPRIGRALARLRRATVANSLIPNIENPEIDS